MTVEMAKASLCVYLSLKFEGRKVHKQSHALLLRVKLKWYVNATYIRGEISVQMIHQE